GGVNAGEARDEDGGEGHVAVAGGIGETDLDALRLRRRRVHRDAHRRRAVAAGVGEVDGRLEAGDEAVVRVGGRTRERGQRRRVLQGAAGVVPGELAHAAVAVAGEERVLTRP